MTTSSITIQYPTSDTTDSLQILKAPTVHTIVNGAGVNITDAFKCKDNTLTIVLTNSTASDGKAIFKKGAYQNAVLGNCEVDVAGNSTVIVKVENPSRFEQSAGGLLIDFSTGFSGSIYAFGKKAGLA